jgi:hypothetical protein
MVVGTRTGLQVFMSSKAGGGRIFFSSPKRPDGFWGPPTFLCKGCRGSFHGAEQLSPEVNLRVLSRLRLSGATRVTPTPPPPIYIHGVETENFTVSFYFPVRKVWHKSHCKNHNARYVTVFTYRKKNRAFRYGSVYTLTSENVSNKTWISPSYFAQRTIWFYVET